MARFVDSIKSWFTPKIRAHGTEFEARTQDNLVKAGTGSTIPDGQRFGNLPPVRRTESNAEPIDWDDVTGRKINNDPRELYWGVLPNKIQPKQAMFMVRAAMGGDLWQFWRLTENMLNTWPKFAMAQHQLREAVSYVRFVAHPFALDGETPTDSALERRDLVQRALNSMTPNGFNDEKNKSGMVFNFTDAVLRGIALEEIIWKDPERAPGGKWQRLPKATAWTHPRHFTFNQEGNVIIFSSASSLNVGDARRFGKGIGEIPNPNKMICSQFMSRSGSSLVNGFAMQLVWWWCARQYGLDFVLRMAQNFGNPFVDVTYKPGMSSQEKLAMVSEIIKGLGNRVLMHQEGTTLNLEPAQNLGSDNPQRWIIEESDREVLYLLLGQTGSTISSAGKLGSEDTHNDVKKERVAGVAEWVAQNSLEQFARAVLRVNYGNDAECPSFRPDFTKPLNAQEVGSLATSVSTSKMPVKVNEHYQKLGYTPPKPGDEVFQGGEIKILGEPMTDEEKQEKLIDQQMQMAESQSNLDWLNEAGDKKKKPVIKAWEPFQRGTNYRTLLGKASETELAEIESLITAVETAPHHNGEVKALEASLEKLKRRK